MSSGMRRVRRDTTLPSVSTSKSAPRLFSSSTRNGAHQRYSNNSNKSVSSDRSLNGKEKSLTRKMNPLNEVDREVSIDVVNTFNENKHTEDLMSLRSALLNVQNRNSINEIRKQYKMGIYAKGFFLCTLIVFVMTQIVSFTRGFGTREKDMSHFQIKQDVSNLMMEDEKLKDVLKTNNELSNTQQTNIEQGNEDSSKSIEKSVVTKASIQLKGNDDIKKSGMSDKMIKDYTATLEDKNLIPKVLKTTTILSTDNKLKKKKVKVLKEDQHQSDNDEINTGNKSNENVNDKKQRIRRKKKHSSNTTKKVKTSQKNKEAPKLTGGASLSVKFIPDIPEALGNFADISSKVNLKNDMPFYWDIHLGGGTVVEHIFGKCHKLLQASEMGVTHDMNDSKLNKTLQVLSINEENYLNVDTTTQAGLNHAKSLNFMNSPLSPSIIYSPLIHEVGSIFTPSKRGRMFTLFRHPIERAVGMYFYLQTAKWDPLYNPELSKMSIEEYAMSASMENNWMTRFLVNKKGGKLTIEDLNVAKEIIKRKCVVGLFEKMEESLIRFEIYFGWRAEMSSKQKKCEKKLLENGDERHDHPIVEKGTKGWKALMQQNRFDMELYQYAVKLFDEQGKIKKL